MVENLFSALGCFAMSFTLNEMPLNKFWNFGGLFLCLTAVAIYLSGSKRKRSALEMKAEV
jgi:hypothetical protein